MAPRLHSPVAVDQQGSAAKCRRHVVASHGEYRIVIIFVVIIIIIIIISSSRLAGHPAAGPSAMDERRWGAQPRFRPSGMD